MLKDYSPAEAIMRVALDAQSSLDRAACALVIGKEGDDYKQCHLAVSQILWDLRDKVTDPLAVDEDVTRAEPATTPVVEQARPGRRLRCLPHGACLG